MPTIIGSPVANKSASGNLTLSKTLTAGSTLILAIAENDGTGTSTCLPTISGGGGTWTQVVAASLVAFHTRASIWRMDGATAGAATITVTPNAGADSLAAGLTEWAALAAVDKTATGGAFSTTPTAGPTAATTTASEVVIAAWANDGSVAGATVPATGYTNIANQVNAIGGLVADYLIVSSTGTQTANWGTQTTGDQWTSAIATFADAPVLGNSDGWPVGGFVAVGRLLASSGAVTHATSGVLTGQLGTVAGSATRFHAFSASGVLTGQIGSIVGSAARSSSSVTHDGTGALVGSIGSIAGSSTRFRAMATSGALTGQGSTIVGSAVYNAVHPTSGNLIGSGAVVTSNATRFHAFGTSGVLTGQGAVVVGSANRGTGPVTHDTTGTLVGPGSSIVGSANRVHVFDSTGALVGQLGAIAGSATRFHSFSTTGALTGQSSSIVGVALRFRVHPSTGALIGAASTIVGAASRSGTGPTYPSPGDVRLGVTYGPTGADFTGTLVVGSAYQVFMLSE